MKKNALILIISCWPCWLLANDTQSPLELTNLWTIETNKQQANKVETHSKDGQTIKLNKDVFNNLKKGDIVRLDIDIDSGFNVEIVKISNYENKSISYIAKPESNNGFEFMVTTVGEKQIFSTIVTSDGVYTLRNIDGQAMLLNEKLLPQLNQDDMVLFENGRASSLIKNQESSLNSVTNTNGIISTIGILVLLTAETHAHYDNDASIRIAHLIAVTNQIYTDSNVDIQLELVGIDQVIYDESKPTTTILDEMRNENDPAFENLGVRRYETGGDLAMFVKSFNSENDDACGRAALLGLDGRLTYSRAKAFSYVGLGCLDYTFAHEIGHNLGLWHSRVQNSSGIIFPYALGYGVDNNFVTVMAYKNEFSNAQKKYLFSNPLLDCNDLPCGIDRNSSDGADAVFALNQIREQAASFFDAEPSLIAIGEVLENSNNMEFSGCVYQNQQHIASDYAGEIEQINCSGKNLTNLDAISLFPHLNDLRIQASQLNDISALTGQKNIHSLNLATNKINDISVLSSLVDIQSIDLSSNQINDINALSNLNYLHTVTLSNNLVNDLSPISFLPRLSSLFVKNNPIDDFSVLQNMDNLNHLSLNQNEIVDIKFLTNMPSLLILTLSNNQIVDITPLKSLINIGILHLDQNNLSDISVLFELIDNDFIQLHLDHNNEIFCWQQDYISPFFELDQFKPSEICSNIDDNNDFDGDGISNRDELTSGTNPIIKTSVKVPLDSSSSGGGSSDMPILLLSCLYLFFFRKQNFNLNQI